MAASAIPMQRAGSFTPPGDLRSIWLIARRAALESLHDRTTQGASAVFSLLVPIILVLTMIRPQAMHTGSKADTALGLLMAVYLLVVGLLPTSNSISVASGLFAGEKEQGNLAPLLATPASNRAIFGGKVLGAVLPSLLYAVVAVSTYLLEIALFVGTGKLHLLPLGLSLAMLALVPIYAVFGAAVASLISSRVRTYQGAQTLASVVMFPLMAVLFGVAFAMQHWGIWWLGIAVLVLVGIDVLIVTLGAATWRREEVLARR
ncbi:MAG TPA: ABC transporter permease [Chloroflexota bacterium]|nr:ABC transporter permease [Chloroflexota bacterium]